MEGGKGNGAELAGLRHTEGERAGDISGLGRGSSSVGCVENVNWGHWLYFHSRDWKFMSVLETGIG